MMTTIKINQINLRNNKELQFPVSQFKGINKKELINLKLKKVLKKQKPDFISLKEV
jgi:hypothetical protein